MLKIPTETKSKYGVYNYEATSEGVDSSQITLAHPVFTDTMIGCTFCGGVIQTEAELGWDYGYMDDYYAKPAHLACLKSHRQDQHSRTTFLGFKKINEKELKKDNKRDAASHTVVMERLNIIQQQLTDFEGPPSDDTIKAVVRRLTSYDHLDNEDRKLREQNLINSFTDEGWDLVNVNDVENGSSPITFYVFSR